MGRAAKGSDFEREICKRLSMWWTDQKRDDVFWRSSQSGGRATQRRKFGKDTYGSEGDVAAVDPIGTPLLEFATIELKRGSSIGCAGDLIDVRDSEAIRPFEAAINQAVEAHHAAKSLGWILLCKRDHRKEMVYIQTKIFSMLAKKIAGLTDPPIVQFGIFVNCQGTMCETRYFIAMSLVHFLERVKPADIKKCLHENKEP